MKADNPSSANFLIDRFNRRISYLRISVTDRCNMRCIYCMPPSGIIKQTHTDILTYEEITQIVETAAGLGIEEIRLTGGEPLVRSGLPDLVRMLSKVPGIRQISLTTNGLLLAPMVNEFKEAGLNRVNFSLDTLQPFKFKQITRGGSFESAWAGIQAAESAGLTPIKINVVVMRGINDDEILDLAKLALNHPWHIRFIELMPLVELSPSEENNLKFSPQESYMSLTEIRQRLVMLNLEPSTDENEHSPAKLFRIPSGQGWIGFIAPISGPFCAACNRLRLSADGHLRGCLLDDSSVSLREAVRKRQDLLPFFQQVLLKKPQMHGLSDKRYPTPGCMHQIGG